MRSLTRLSPLLLAAALPACHLFGEFDEHPLVTPPSFSDDKLGDADGLSTVLRVPMGPAGQGAMGRVGKLAYHALFEDAGYAPFVVNVSFACSRPRLGRSEYADARSIWFNVFLGFYQIDVTPEHYDHPFGYKRQGDALVLDFEALARLGKADWNYFSNHVYGVPLDVVRRYDRVPSPRAEDLGRTRVGDRYWDTVELRDIKVVSAYEAEDDRRLEDTFGDLTQIWQMAFGTTRPGDRFPRSFAGTRMRARLYLAYSTEPTPGGKPAFHTHVFGATINEDYPDHEENERFLELQLGALRGAIFREAGDDGFPGPR